MQRKFSPLLSEARSRRLAGQDGAPVAGVRRPALGRGVPADVRAATSRISAWRCTGRMGLLDGIRVARSSDPGFRRAACDVDGFFVDVPYEGEIVRARLLDGELETARRAAIRT